MPHNVMPRFSIAYSSLLACGMLLGLTAAQAQRADSARAAVVKAAPSPPAADTVKSAVPQPPLSPRRAFLSSLVVPGFGQARLGRPTAGAIFVFTESIAWAMLRESAADLREARRFRTDSLVFLGNDPITGSPVMQKSPYNDGLISIRKGHVEDWVAFLVGNHLFAAADAYVAAHLWDLPSQIDVAQTSAGTMVVARLKF
ncbi:MAG: hypothetical protein ABJE47_11420 [bacterium]